MKKDFEWLKWVGFSLAICILVAGYFIKSNGRKEFQVDQSISAQENKKYEEKLNQAAIAMSETQEAAKKARQNPSAYESISLEQTKKYIDRIEQLRASDSSVDLSYLPDVAAHSRRYNALVEEAENIYGESDISNPLRFCVAMPIYARDYWMSKYSPTLPKEYLEINKKRLVESYLDAKKGCIEDIQSKEN